MNNYKEKIQQIINSANTDIKLAVSWFTEGELTNSLIKKARTGVKIQLLLSADDYNLIRYNDFRLLESYGAEIKKKGNSNALDGDFMHAKILIIDQKAAFGGSYNYTYNAATNYEVFDEFKNPYNLLQDFNQQFKTATSLLAGLTEEIANGILSELERQFKSLTSKPVVLSTKSPNSSITLSEYERLQLAKKSRVNQLQEQKNGLQSGKIHISAEAKPTIPVAASQPVRKHTYHAGGVMAGYIPQRRNKFAAVNYQKYFIDKRYTIFKTNIQNETLTCKGVIQVDGCPDYDVRISFTAGRPPKVTLPNVEVHSKFHVHLYEDNSLCLYYPQEQKWTDYTKIAAYTIPWVVEWIYLYEIWKLTGKWEAEESPVHQARNKKMESINL